MPEDLIPWFRVDFGDDELARIEEAIGNRRVTMGPVSDELERRLASLLDVREVVLVNSGASALAVSLAACGVGPGDEVIVPGLSFIATAHAPMLLGATVRLADVLPNSPLMDPESVALLITERTRAIIPVHLNGRAVDIDRISGLARDRNIAVIEDAAQALASRDAKGRPLGTVGNAGCFSLGVTKLVATAEGGAVTSPDADVLARCRRLRNNGFLSLSEDQYAGFGFNFRPVDLLSAMGLARMDRLDRTIESLVRVYRFYRRELADIPFLRLIEVDVDGGELPLWIEAVCADRDRVVGELAERGVQARPFPPSIEEADYLSCVDRVPNARHHAARGLVLPSGPDQTPEDLEGVVVALKDVGRGIQEIPE